MNRTLGRIGALWGIVGVSALLLFAIWRLAPRALDAFDTGLTVGQWLLTGAACVFMAYTEGYRGFQHRFSPRTAARLRHLREHPDGLRTLLAPAFAMGFFHATRRTLLTAYALTCGVVILVVLVQRLEQPWRGIIDAGVVTGLAWGIVSLWWSTAQALTRPAFDASPEVP